MARRKSDSPQKAAMREMMSVLLEGALDEELNEELECSKYDYHNKETDNSRNAIPRKQCVPVMVIWTLQSQEIAKGSMNRS